MWTMVSKAIFSFAISCFPSYADPFRCAARLGGFLFCSEPRSLLPSWGDFFPAKPQSAAVFIWPFPGRWRAVRCLSNHPAALHRESHRDRSLKLQESYFKPVVQQHFSSRRQPEYREALKQRQICCESTFAAQKWGHSLTRVLRRGLEAAEDHCLLSAAALNLKRMIRCLSWRWWASFFSFETRFISKIQEFCQQPHNV